MKTPFLFLAIGALATSLFSQTGTNTLLIQAGPNGSPANTQVKANQPTLSYAVVKIYPNGAPAGAFIKKITNSGYALLLNYSSTPLISRWQAGVLTNLDQSSSQENSSEDINNDGTVVGRTSTGLATWSASSTSPATISLNWSWEKGIYNYSLVNPYSTTSPAPRGFLYINDSGAILGSAKLYAYPDENVTSYGFRHYANDTFFWSSPGAVPVRKGDFYYAWPRQSQSGTDTPAAGKYFYFPLALNNDNVWVAYAIDASQPNAFPFQSLSTTSQPLDFSFSDMSDGTSPRLVGETYWWQAGNKNSLSAVGIKRAYKINNQYDIVAEDNTGATTLLTLDLIPGTPLASQNNYKSVGLSLPFGWENPRITDINDNRLLSALVDYVPYSSSGAANGPIQKAQPVILVPAELAVDTNRDGMLTLSSESSDPTLSDKTTQTKPYRFWSNDDDDSGEVRSDRPNPGASANGAELVNAQGEGRVDGKWDLLDFFPVYLDIKQLLAVLPHSSGVKYKLKHEEEALNFVYTKLTRETAFNFQGENPGNIFGFTLNGAADSAGTLRITANGIEISTQFLDWIKDHNGGVLLVEGYTPTAKPLVLSVEQGDQVIAEIKLDLIMPQIRLTSDYAASESARQVYKPTFFREYPELNPNDIFEKYDFPACTIYYKDVVNADFQVRDYDVDLKVSPWEQNETWKKTAGPSSGAITGSSPDFKYQNPKQGGIYELEVEIKGKPTKTFLLLPLAGPEMGAFIASDIARSSTFISTVISKYTLEERNDPINGWRWFVADGAGDYVGRPDNANNRTIWKHNQVSDDNGLGAVVTWFGYPTRLSKLSNFMVAYAARKIGVSDTRAWLSQLIGTNNDSAATKSWDAGWSVAGGSDYNTTAAAAARDIWDEQGDKNQKLWPNPATPDNWISSPGNYNREFCSPGFIAWIKP